MHRYYDPATGQFLTVDPAVDTTDQPYAYATGNPTNTSDPDGDQSPPNTNTCAALGLVTKNQQSPVCMPPPPGSPTRNGQIAIANLSSSSGGQCTLSPVVGPTIGDDCAPYISAKQASSNSITPPSAGSANKPSKRSATAGASRSASTPFGQLVQSLKGGDDGWQLVSAHAEPATSGAYRGGTSIEEVFERGADRLVRHRIYDSSGNIVHETFRPYAKFGAL